VKLKEERLDELIQKLRFTDDGGRVIERLASYQREIVLKMVNREHRRMCIVACTQVGKTTSVMIGALLNALFYPGEEIWIVSINYNHAVSKFNMIKRTVETSPLLAAAIDFTRPFRRDGMWFKNGSVIRCLSAESRKGILGYSATLLIVDEAQEIKNEVWRTKLLRMIVGSGMKQPPVVVLIGTANKINFFRDAYLSKEWWKMKITWRDGVKAGILRKEDVEFARKNLSEQEFMAWYEAEFVGEGGALFDLAKVRDAMTVSRPSLEFNAEDFNIWMGVDIARFGEDESCVVMIRLPRDFEWGQTPAEMFMYERRWRRNLSDIVGWITHLVNKYKPVAIGVDETGVGGGVVDLLRERFGNAVRGVRFVGRERDLVYEALVMAVKEGQIRLLKDDELYAQFANFGITYGSDGRPRVVKTPGRRDDIVDALAIAVYLASFARRFGRVTVLDLKGWL
jgi:hypothetical protein